MATPIHATLASLRACQAQRAAGQPVAYTTDPAWLVEQAINRRSDQFQDDPTHSRGSCRTVLGRYPRKAEGERLQPFAPAQPRHQYAAPDRARRRAGRVAAAVTQATSATVRGLTHPRCYTGGMEQRLTTARGPSPTPPPHKESPHGPVQRVCCRH